MPTIPFEDQHATYLVLINDEGQYSLWPSFGPIPPGWYPDHQEASRDACLQHVAGNWIDMRPKSIRALHPTATP